MPTHEEEAALKAEQDAKAKADVETEAKSKETQDADFDTWLAKQPKDVQDKFSTHISGLKSALEKERASSKELTKAQKRLKELEEAEAKRAEAEMSEKERLEKRVAEAEAKREQAEKDLRENRVRIAIEREAVKLKFRDVEDVYKYLDPASFEITEDGKVKGAKEAVEALAKAKDYLLDKQDKGNGSPRSKGKTSLPESNIPQAAIPRL